MPRVLEKFFMASAWATRKARLRFLQKCGVLGCSCQSGGSQEPLREMAKNDFRTNSSDELFVPQPAFAQYV